VRRFEGTTSVVASRISEAASAGRREIVLSRDEIATLPVASVQDLLAAVPGVGLVRRGARGVQADLSLRGATFEQAVVLVDGVRVASPQTGHHTLDLFVPLDAIERVEVVTGPGAAVHGADAFGGVINIVTGVEGTGGYLRTGEHDLDGAGVHTAAGGAWLAAEREVHTGFQDGTEAWINRLAGGFRWRQGSSSGAVLATAGARDFGAFKFYSQTYPWQHERTSRQRVSATADLPLGSLALDLALAAGRHRDRFVLDRRRPEWFVNRHRTDSLSARAVVSRRAGEEERSQTWQWLVGVEALRDEIDSSNLGRRHRSRLSGFGEAWWSGARGVRLGVQGRLDHEEPWGAVSTLAAGGSVRLSGSLLLRLHHGQSFRAPTFTDRFYSSPATVGDPELAPERGRSSEIGLDAGALSVTAFERRAHPLIDYVLADDGVWYARNIGRLTTRGIEVAFVLAPDGDWHWQRFGAMWLDSSSDLDPSRSRYALNHPRLEAAWSGQLRLADGWSAGWVVRLRDPRRAGSWAVADLRVSRELGSGWALSVSASNAADREVTELSGVPLPGRWLTATVRYRVPAASSGGG
jgi:iron complex outermembrane receptor protein